MTASLEPSAKCPKKLDGTANSSSDKKEVEQLSNTLVSLRCTSIRTRVDRIFQERLRSASRKNIPDRTLEEAQAEKEALKEELETLHAEIKSVAEMSVEHEFRGPINASIEQSQTQQQRLQQRWLDYILSTVEYMTHRLSHLCTHATDIRAFYATLTEISDLYIATMQSGAPPPPTLPSSSSPSKSRGKDTATRVVELSKATEELLRHLDMSIPTPDKTSPAQARQSLAESTLERQNRLLLHQSATQAAVVKSIGEAVGNGNLEMQELLGALLANSEFKDLSLGNRRLVRGIEGLEVGIGHVSSYMPGLGERMDLAGSREGRAFVERWAGDI